jgi:hypothetical protein
VRPEPCLPLAPSSVKRREREWLLKSHCASWSLEIEDFGGTHNWTLSNKQASAQHGSYHGSTFHLLYDCPSLISPRLHSFSKPILGVEENEGAFASSLLRFALASGKSTVTP